MRNYIYEFEDNEGEIQQWNIRYRIEKNEVIIDSCICDGVEVDDEIMEPELDRIDLLIREFDSDLYGNGFYEE